MHSLTVDMIASPKEEASQKWRKLGHDSTLDRNVTPLVRTSSMGIITTGETTPAPTNEERVIPLKAGGEFPPIRSRNQSAWWKLQRID